MLVYEDEQHTVFAWNAVDVRVDGQLQHGEVIDVAEGGLIIDFRCAGHRAHFVAYGSIFDSRYQETWPTYVQVLLRRASDGAWIWYHGEVLPLGPYLSNRSEYVEVLLPHDTVRELVPVDQVRPQPSDEDLQGCVVTEKDFVIRSCPLPGTYWADESRVLKELFKAELGQRCKVRCTSVLSQTMLYLQCQNAAPLTIQQVEEAYAWAKKEAETDSPCPTSEHIFRQMATRSASKKRKSGQPQKKFPLPSELLVDIFQSLDSIGRVRCRRVCQLWNTLLTTDAYFPDVRVSGWQSDAPDLPFIPDMYWMVVCLLKCLHRTTKTLVITGLDIVQCRSLAAVARHILSGYRVRTLVLNECRFSYLDMEEEEEDYFPDMVNCLVGLAEDFAADSRMVWKRCRLAHDQLEAVVVQQGFHVRSREEMALQVWEVFEKSLVLERPLDRPAVKDWIAACVEQHDDSQIDDIIRAVGMYQSADPRPATLHRGRGWTAADIGQLDVSEMNVLTAASFSEAIDLSLPATDNIAKRGTPVDPPTSWPYPLDDPDFDF
ncbi:uncharacterized protein LOC129592403 [Paramacrobiotus metropolitanus]|uniref:uncharacterized protein LOC129592403 n=1 Tax=Paramacrobiotus metropolitanus TaxID=2943436 RepID=UPI00244595CA|nr:uncharacterized protein LOC129592403 [Paramacrobiotus metropolitanus]